MIMTATFAFRIIHCTVRDTYLVIKGTLQLLYIALRLSFLDGGHLRSFQFTLKFNLR